MTTTASRAFALWAPLALATSGIFLFAYWGIQQEYRMSANDPQIQLAEDGAARLVSGDVPAYVVGTLHVLDIKTSSAPWIAIYDGSGKPVTGTAILDEAAAQLPKGVYDTSTWRHSAEFGVPLSTPASETRFSWQPESGVRQAVVLVHVDSPAFTGFIASGRSLNEVEARVATLTQGAALIWGATELGTLLAIAILITLGWL